MSLPPLQVGERVRVSISTSEIADAPDFVVDVVEQSRFWIEAPDDPFPIGGRVVAERTVPGDARYRGIFEVVSRARDSTALKPCDDWNRVQARNFVRVVTPRVPVDAILRDPQADVAQLWLADISAGGMLAETTTRLDCNTELDCRFKLPNSSELFVLPAQVVRLIAERGLEGALFKLGIQFLDLPEPVVSELLRWVFREQVRRNTK
jgi:c-di-GMP-binding flagellar brake protein YcgR